MNASQIIQRVSGSVRWARDRVRRRSRPVLAGLCMVVAMACAAVVGLVGFAPASADNAIAGKGVDGATAQSIMVAALSCPVLSGPRLAGTMMADTGMNFTAGTGVSGLTSSVFAKWAPWPKASVSDPDASIYALAHYLCALAGQLRHAKVEGDQWDDTLAAHHAGVAAVRKAGGVPSGTQTYVDTVNGYAAWYAKQPGFTTQAGPTPRPDDSAAAASFHVQAETGTAAVPDEDVAAIKAAGSICPAITPPMVAAQLMAASGFNPNLRAATQAMGIAQFLPSMWMDYAPSISASPWDPTTAITSLGSTMCQLTQQFALISAKPYELALAAFRVGPTAVRQAGGVPRIAPVMQFVRQVEANTAKYAKDSRLALDGASTAPGTGASPKPGTTSPAATTSGPPAANSTPATRSTPAGHSSPTPATSTFVRDQKPPVGPITGVLDLCLDIPSSVTTNDHQLQVWGCNGTPAQTWTFHADGTITAMGKCVDAEGFGKANGTIVVIHSCNGGTNQKWVYHSDTHEITAVYAPSMCLGVAQPNIGWGSLVRMWTCLGLPNQKWNLPG